MMVVYGYAGWSRYDADLELGAGHPRDRVEVEDDRSSPSICAPATAGPTASPSPPRISATGGRTSPTTRPARPSARRRTCCRRRAAEVRGPRRDRPSATPGRSPTRSSCRRWPAARPLYIFRPRALPEEVPREIRRPGGAEGARSSEAGQKSWAHLHNRMDNAVPQRQPGPADARALGQYRRGRRPSASSSSAIPITTASTRPGTSCPISTASLVQIADSKLIPAKTGAGEADLQARYLRFDDYTFLKQAAKRNDYKVDLWGRQRRPSGALSRT